MDYLKKFESYKPEEGLVEYFIDLDSSQGGNFDIDIRFSNGLDDGEEYLMVWITFLKEYDYVEILKNISSIIKMIRTIGEFETTTETKNSKNFGAFLISRRAIKEDPWWVNDLNSNKYVNEHIDLTDESLDPEIFKDLCIYYDHFLDGHLVHHTSHISIRQITIWFKRI